MADHALKHPEPPTPCGASARSRCRCTWPSARAPPAASAHAANGPCACSSGSRDREPKPPTRRRHLIAKVTVTSAVMSCVPGSTGVGRGLRDAGRRLEHRRRRARLLGHDRDRPHTEAAGVGERQRLRARVLNRLLQRVAVLRVLVGHGQRRAVDRVRARRDCSVDERPGPRDLRRCRHGVVCGVAGYVAVVVRLRRRGTPAGSAGPMPPAVLSAAMTLFISVAFWLKRVCGSRRLRMHAGGDASPGRERPSRRRGPWW